MKYIFFFVLFVVVASKNLKFDPKLNEHWENFKKAFGKVYDDSEEIIRRSIGEQKVADIAQHNLRYDLGLHSFRVGINEHSDMEHKEFVKIANGYLQQSGLKTNASAWVPVIDAKIPDHVDWRTKGYVTPVLKQGKCASCWAFVTAGVIEGQVKRETGKLVPLSVQNLVDCSENNRGCKGGMMQYAYFDIKEEKGIDKAASYPYTAKEGDCRFNLSTVVATVRDYVQLPRGNERALKKAVATIGPIAVVIHSSQPSFHSYKDGIYDDDNCGWYDHAVLVVGYGTEDGKDYWLIKNSWGTSWGIKGYGKMSRNKRNQCQIATLATYPFVKSKMSKI